MKAESAQRLKCQLRTLNKVSVKPNKVRLKHRRDPSGRPRGPPAPGACPGGPHPSRGPSDPQAPGPFSPIRQADSAWSCRATEQLKGEVDSRLWLADQGPPCCAASRRGQEGDTGPQPSAPGSEWQSPPGVRLPGQRQISILSCLPADLAPLPTSQGSSPSLPPGPWRPPAPPPTAGGRRHCPGQAQVLPGQHGPLSELRSL